MTKKIIRGAKGGGRSRTPQRAPDSLNSRQFASILDLLSEGEIEGFSTASKAGLTFGTAPYLYASLKDVFLDGTQILKENASNTNPTPADFNYGNVRFDLRKGLNPQPLIPGIKSSGTPKPVNVLVPTGPGISRTITNHLVDAVEVTISFDSLQLLKDDGDIEGSEVNLQIIATYNNGTPEVLINDTVKGRSADSYQKEYKFFTNRTKFNASGHTLDVTVKRITSDTTDDHTSGKLQDKLRFIAYEEIVEDGNTYPNSAYTLLRLDSEQFSTIPKRVFKIRGIKVKIPGAGANNSGTPTVVKNQSDATALGLGTVSSFGFIHYPAGYVFNGTMQQAQWTTCPAMILLDLLTNQRYGFGTHIAPNYNPQSPSDADLYENVDLFSLVTASKYSNELVDDFLSSSTREPRFSCNVNIQSSKDAFTLINELSGVMRGFPLWQTGDITFAQDSPTTPSYLFSLANVTEAGFIYTGSSLKKRHTMIHVSYLNMDTQEIDTEIIEDPDARAKLGIVEKRIKAFGTTSRGQAIRLGKAILFSEQFESEVVMFETTLDAGVLVRPGNVISIADPVRNGYRRSGRIKAATQQQITIDDTEDLTNLSGTITASFVMPNGSVESKTCTVADDKINLSSPLGSIPNVNSIWSLSTSSAQTQKFRVISVEEKDELSFSISAITYLDGKYNNIEQGTPLPPRNISLLNQPKAPPTNLKITDQNGLPKEMLVIINNLAVSKLLLTWVGVSGVTQYLVQYRFNKGNWFNEVVFKTDFELFNTEAGTYEFRVFSFNAALVLSSSSADLTFQALGKTEPPDDVQNLTIEPLTNKLVRLRWEESINPDVIHGGKVYVRHSNKTDGSGTFQNSIDLIEALAGNTTDAVVPALEGEYILKFRDDQGNFSLGETSIILDLPDLIDAQEILSDREDTDPSPFGGTKVNTSIVGSALQLSNTATNLTGTYDFAAILDCEAVFSLNLKRLIQSIGFAIDGQTITATYVRTTATISGQSQTVIEITSANHGRSVDNYINFVALTGGATNGVFRIVAATTNTFQFLATGSAISSSNCTFAFVNTIDTLIPTGTFWDDYAPNGNFDGPLINDTNAVISVATTSTPPANSVSGVPTYDDTDFASKSFNTFANGTYKGRGFKFRVTLKSETVGHNVSVQQLGINADFESRTERAYKVGGNTSTSSQNNLDNAGNPASKTVEFAHPFFVGTANLGGLRAFMPSIGITIENAQSGDFFTITQPTNSDAGKKFTIDIKNGSNFVNRNFSFQAVGYGKGV